MHFLIDANLPRRTADVVRRAGHEATDVRDIGMASAKDTVIAAHALTHTMSLLTQDGDFSDIRNYPPELYAGIVVFSLPDDWVAEQILGIVQSTLTQHDLLSRLPGRLAIVSPGRVRLRPP